MKRSMIAAVVAVGMTVAPTVSFAQTATSPTGHAEKGKMEKSSKTKHTGTTGSASHKGSKSTSEPSGAAGNSPDAGGGTGAAK